MKSLHLVIVGRAVSGAVETTRASCAWASRVTEVAGDGEVAVEAPWTLVLRPGERLPADAADTLGRQLVDAPSDRWIIPVRSTWEGAACASDLLSPAREVRLLRPPATWMDPAMSLFEGAIDAPSIRELFIHRALEGGAAELASSLPVELDASRAVSRALEAWRQRALPGCSVQERRALALYAWRLLVEADRIDGDRLGEMLAMPVTVVRRSPDAALAQLSESLRDTQATLAQEQERSNRVVAELEKVRRDVGVMRKSKLGRAVHDWLRRSNGV